MKKLSKEMDAKTKHTELLLEKIKDTFDIIEVHKSNASHVVEDKITEITTSDEFKIKLTNTVENIVNTYICQQPGGPEI